MAARRRSTAASGIGNNAQSDTAIFTGGLDLTSQALMIPSGNVIDCKNYEPGITGGYRRMDGYEARDGHAAPSAANYYVLPVNITGAVVVGATITGATSGATGYVLAAVGATQIIFTALTGAFANVENLTVGGVVQSATTAAAAINGAATLALHVQYRGLAAAYYRALIQPLPGSGNVLGVVMYDNVVYGWRNNAGGTAAQMWMESPTGWQAVTMPYEVHYSGGSGTPPAVGATIVQGGVSGVLQAITIESGSFTGTNAVGRLIFNAITGGNFTAAAFTSGITATCGGAQTLFSFLPNGRYECDIYNYSALANGLKLYWADGVNRGCEFNGTVIVPLTTGMEPLAPQFVRNFQNQLFFSYGAQLQQSAIGNPYNWTLLSGAASLAMGDNITCMLPQVGENNGQAMAVCTRSSTWILYGSSPANWQLVPQAWDVGCIPYMSVQMMQPYFFSNRGLTTLEAVLAFGNFERSILTEKIQTFIQAKIGMGTAACIVRQKSHLRFFFNDGTFLIVGFVGGIAGDVGQYGRPADEEPDLMIGTYPVPVLVCWSSETVSATATVPAGTETVLFGSTDGYVYQTDKGTSFNGQAIEAWIRSAYNPINGPRVRKRFFSGEFEINITDQCDISLGYDLSYGDPDASVTPATSLTLAGAGGNWDSFIWDEFTWDAASVVTQKIDTPGRGRNIGYAAYSNTVNDGSWTLFSVTTRYENIRLMR